MRSTTPLEWMRGIRLRVYGFLLALMLAVIATLSLTALPALPVVGVAVAAAAFAVNTMVAKLRLEQPVCLACGENLSQATPGVYGVVCPGCGTIDATLLASRDDDGSAELAAVLALAASDDSSDDAENDDALA